MLDDRHPRRLIGEYIGYYLNDRTHLGFDKITYAFLIERLYLRSVPRVAPPSGQACLENSATTRSEARSPRSAGGARSRMARVREFLSDHLADDVALDDLAAVAELSRYHLIRAFRQWCGLTPFAYQRSQRVGSRAQRERRRHCPNDRS